uniref:Uncharacterized protein n=1 Tax=Hyaloperonospora arabidopsidis (strain Emoy2) TaxID=559515 RepID=M4BCF6_HYAAE
MLAFTYSNTECYNYCTFITLEHSGDARAVLQAQFAYGGALSRERLSYTRRRNDISIAIVAEQLCIPSGARPMIKVMQSIELNQVLYILHIAITQS